MIANFAALAPLEFQGIIGLIFKTNGVGEPTLSNNYGGAVSIAKDGNVYTITINSANPVTEILSLNVNHNHTMDVNLSNYFDLTDPLNPEFVFWFTAPMFNDTVNILITYTVDLP